MYDCSMVAAFGSGVMFSLVSGMGGPNQATNVITSGVFFALVQGGLFKVIVLLCVGVCLSFVRARCVKMAGWVTGLDGSCWPANLFLFVLCVRVPLC